MVAVYDKADIENVNVKGEMSIWDI